MSVPVIDLGAHVLVVVRHAISECLVRRAPPAHGIALYGHPIRRVYPVRSSARPFNLADRRDVEEFLLEREDEGARWIRGWDTDEAKAFVAGHVLLRS